MSGLISSIGEATRASLSHDVVMFSTGCVALAVTVMLQGLVVSCNRLLAWDGAAMWAVFGNCKLMIAHVQVNHLGQHVCANKLHRSELLNCLVVAA
jgi:hypothetical protein